MKFAEITQKSDAELATLLADSRKQLAQLAIDSRTKQVANVKQIHAVKRTVARTLTLQRQRQIEQTIAAVASVAEPAADIKTSEKEENHG